MKVDEYQGFEIRQVAVDFNVLYQGVNVKNNLTTRQYKEKWKVYAEINAWFVI